MDTMFSDTPALTDGRPGHGGCTQVQLFVCTDSRMIRVYPMAHKGQVASTLLQFINDCGAPVGFILDGAMEACGKEVQDIERQMMIRSHWVSEPDNQQQNPAEWVIGNVERTLNVNMDRTGAPAPLWLLCTLHVVALLCVMAHPALGGMSPHQKMYGVIPDVSPYLMFHWYQPVRYALNSNSSLSTMNERAGYMMGVADGVGDALTWWILDDETNRLVARSVVRPRQDDLNPNLRLDMPNISATTDGEMFVYTQDGLEESFRLGDLARDGESAGAEMPATTTPSPEPGTDYFWDSDELVAIEEYVPPPSARPQANPSGPRPHLPMFSPEELIGRTWIQTLDDGQEVKHEVVRKLETMDAANHHNLKMLLKLDDGSAEEIMDYIALCDMFEEMDAKEAARKDMRAGIEDDPNRLWVFEG